MGRHTNPLLADLLADKTKLDNFITLVNSLGSANDVREHFRTNEFLGKKYYLSSQTVRGIMRKLGFKGRRGRNPKKFRSSNRYTSR